nr:uncharacterized protein LOC113401956 isoform X2 [Vanessa tameamea]
MVNGNYVLYGDRPSSDSEIVCDHVQTRTAERKTKRKTNKTTSANERHSRNVAELDNETDAVKYEKKIKEPRLLRYVPTTDVEENFVTEKYETYDLKLEEPPKKHTFTKKPKNPADGSINYAYSHSSSSCSSPNLPTISEHGEQYGTYRVRSPQLPNANDIQGYDTKLDKYFAKPREVKTFAAKVGYNGSHPDSLYRVANDSGAGSNQFVRALRVLRWPLALFTVCVALAVFVYFLMPVNMDADSDSVNATYWEESISEAQTHNNRNKVAIKPTLQTGTEKSRPPGSNPPEIDFYDSDHNNYDLSSIVDIVTEKLPKRKLPLPPVFPTHIAPEVQYGNEEADSESSRSPKLLKVTTTVPSDSTLKPHITQKPEKPLAVYFKDGNAITTTSTEGVTITESITHAESSNDIANYLKQQAKINIMKYSKPEIQVEQVSPSSVPLPQFDTAKMKQLFVPKPDVPPEVQEYYSRPAVNRDVKFTSGHSKLFGISIEDAENMKSTTQNSLYNTRVSPTLPTWRDRDDSTTKKYPINGNFDVPQCRSTRLPLCRGVLPYDLAGAPATVGMVDVTTLLPQIEYLVSTNCSLRVRHFACSLLEPECSPPPYSPKLPCYNFCKAIVDSCDGMLPTDLQAMFACNQYSSSNCATARAPCFSRELACGDGSCVPRDWICDGTRDCPGGEDEMPCSACENNEYRCSSGLCITKRWLCDGYADCPSGEDEQEDLCRRRLRAEGGYGEDVGEPGEELAGSAPAPSVRKPNRLHVPQNRNYAALRNGDTDSSQELLMTSDSNNALRRNFTRRPSLSRLSPYKRPKPLEFKHDSEENNENTSTAPIIHQHQNRTRKPNSKNVNINEDNLDDSPENVNLEDLGLFGDVEKEKKEEQTERKGQKKQPFRPMNRATDLVESTKLDKTINTLEKVIDGAGMLRKAARDNREETVDSPESTNTADATDGAAGAHNSAHNSAHASPCPSGELRCVDGRCITFAQLCDGTIDCSDHADEDNCYT